MKKIFVIMIVMSFVLCGVSAAYADGCYMCKGGSYVKYSGSDDQSKRKKAKDCGCEITGTRGSCDAANLKVLCSVLNETDNPYKLANLELPKAYKIKK